MNPTTQTTPDNATRPRPIRHAKPRLNQVKPLTNRTITPGHTSVIALFVVAVFFQRLSVPGLPELPIAMLLVPLILGYAVIRGEFQILPKRAALYLGVVLLSGLMVVVQQTFLTYPVSLGSWMVHLYAFSILVVLPVYQSEAQRDRTHALLIRMSAGLGVISILFILMSIARIPYFDFVAELLPEAIVLQGFANAYPIEWGSDIFKSNAWIGLEPSFISFALGAAFLAALERKTNPITLALIIGGMFATVSGSGFFLITIGAAFMLWRGHRKIRAVRLKLFGAMIVGIIAVLLSPLRDLIGSRILEFQKPGSSASLRAIDPYAYTLHEWLSTTQKFVFGYGAGHTQDLADATQIQGLFAPTPARMAFDYGLPVGIFMLACLIAWLLLPRPNAVAVAGVFSFILLQPTNPSLLLTVLCLGVYLQVTGSDTDSAKKPKKPHPPHVKPQNQVIDLRTN